MQGVEVLLVILLWCLIKDQDPIVLGSLQTQSTSIVPIPRCLLQKKDKGGIHTDGSAQEHNETVLVIVKGSSISPSTA